MAVVNASVIVGMNLLYRRLLDGNHGESLFTHLSIMIRHGRHALIDGDTEVVCYRRNNMAHYYLLSRDGSTSPDMHRAVLVGLHF